MINETIPRFFITGITKENEQYLIDKLERSGFINWWGLGEDTADYIYVSYNLGHQYMKMWGEITDDFNQPRFTAEEYLSDEVSK